MKLQYLAGGLWKLRLKLFKQNKYKAALQTLWLLNIICFFPDLIFDLSVLWIPHSSIQGQKNWQVIVVYQVEITCWWHYGSEIPGLKTLPRWKQANWKKKPADGQSSVLKFAYLLVTMVGRRSVSFNFSFKRCVCLHSCVGFREVAFSCFSVSSSLEAKMGIAVKSYFLHSLWHFGLKLNSTLMLFLW